MRYRLDYKTNSTGQLRTVGDVLAQLERIGEELAGYCEGDVSYNPLGRVSIDFSASLVTEDDQTAADSDLCCMDRPDGKYVLPLEWSEHGVGPDLVDVLEMLDRLLKTIEYLRWDLWVDDALNEPAELSVELTLVTADPRLAARLGFQPEGGVALAVGRLQFHSREGD